MTWWVLPINMRSSPKKICLLFSYTFLGNDILNNDSDRMVYAIKSLNDSDWFAIWTQSGHCLRWKYFFCISINLWVKVANYYKSWHVYWSFCLLCLLHLEYIDNILFSTLDCNWFPRKIQMFPIPRNPWIWTLMGNTNLNGKISRFASILVEQSKIHDFPAT